MKINFLPQILGSEWNINELWQETNFTISAIWHICWKKHNSAQIFCQIFPALPDSDGHVCRLLFFSAASCLPLSISVIWGGAGWLVGGWDNYRNQISDERRVCLSHDPPFSLFPSCLFYLLSSTPCHRYQGRFVSVWNNQSEVLVPAIWISPPSFDMRKKSLKPNKYWLVQTRYWQAVF